MPYMQVLPLLQVVPSLFLSLPLFTQLERVGADMIASCHIGISVHFLSVHPPVHPPISQFARHWHTTATAASNSKCTGTGQHGTGRAPQSVSELAKMTGHERVYRSIRGTYVLLLAARI